MKTSFLLPLLLLIGFSSVQSQITILSTDIAQPGDTIYRAIDTSRVFTQGMSGANQTWDFSGATEHEGIFTYVMLPSSTPFGNDFPASNLAMTSDNLNYVLFSLDSAQLLIDGLAGDLIGTGTNVITEFVPSLTLNQFPMEYGNAFSDEYWFDEVVPGTGLDAILGFPVHEVRLQHHGVTYDTVDGWGTALTSSGSYDCLRNQHTEYSWDTLQFKLLPFSPWATAAELTDTAISYNWVAKESGLSIVELTTDSTGGPDELTYYYVPTVSGINETVEQSWVVYPNPIDREKMGNELYVQAPLETKAAWAGVALNYEILDLSGRRLLSDKLSLDAAGNGSISIEELPRGQYFLQVISREGEMVFGQRFAVGGE